MPQKNNTDYLSKGLKEKYEDTEVNWEGDKLCKINLKLDYNKQTFQANVLGRMHKIQQRCEHTVPSKS